MAWWWVGCALGIPWLAGTLWTRVLFTQNAAAGVWPLSIGYGYVLGLLLTTVLLRLEMVLGLPPDAVVPLILLTILTFVGAARGGYWRKHRVDGRIPTTHWKNAACAVLCAWMCVRLTGLALEILWRPLYPWDAWTTWMVLPRVWSTLHQFTPFIAPEQWLADASGASYTIAASHYPRTIPLIALWPTLAFGTWNETAANLPWFGCAIALGLGFYGQIRCWGASALTAMICTWLLLSLPLLNTHVALAGYTDLWMATVFSFAAMAFFQWIRAGERAQGLLALVLIVACPFVKQEGTVWMLLFVPAFLAARFPIASLLAITACVSAGLLCTVPDGIDLPYLGHFTLAYHNSGWPVAMNLFVLSNWHLLGILMIAAGIATVATIVLRSAARWQWAQQVFIASSLLALFVLFFMTDAYRWAEQYTSINRVFLDFVPIFLFCSFCTYHQIGERRC